MISLLYMLKRGSFTAAVLYESLVMWTYRVFLDPRFIEFVRLLRAKPDDY